MSSGEDHRDMPPALAFFWTLLSMILFLVCVLATSAIAGKESMSMAFYVGAQAVAYGAVLFLIMRVHAPHGSIRKVSPSPVQTR